LYWLLPILANHRSQLEARWLRSLAAGDPAAAYGLAWLGSARAVPELRRQLLGDRAVDPEASWTPWGADAHVGDYRFPHQVAYVLAIEHLTSRPVARAVALSPRERRALRREATPARLDDPRVPPAAQRARARWLLQKLDLSGRA
jgi:hypothetical protein